MKVFFLSLTVLLAPLWVVADTKIHKEIEDKILSAGVPKASLYRMLDRMNANKGLTSSQRVYSCKNKEETNLRPCVKKERTYYFKDIEIKSHRYIVSIDFTLPSTHKRFYFIDLETGDVSKEYVSHGKGSGKDAYAEVFSNTPDSKMTSLGTYYVGERYTGGHGVTLRLYGLDNSNDTAYERDIVFHKARYADETFFEKIDPKTKQKYQRLGLSEGCPAISHKVMDRYLPLLENGGLIDHHHDNFTP
ncbi:MAG: murein L,D-transpeptidase catalytic domain family protein [Oligoflexia bacterium]|nr:murein L,D-transpeptidase catalytic domain family protein [Oligoflexia bacterium]